MSEAEMPLDEKRKRLVTRELRGEVLVYDPDTQHAHCLQPLAAAVWRGSQGAISRDLLKARIERELGCPVAEEQLDQAIAELADAELLPNVELATLPPAGIGRREVLQRIGMGAAALVPLVTTILVPTPAQASTCLAGGSACTSSSQCCSGLCVGAPSGTCA